MKKLIALYVVFIATFCTYSQSVKTLATATTNQNIIDYVHSVDNDKSKYY